MSSEVKKESKIVHESEVQRQFVRLQLPVEVEINGKRYMSEDWSSGGLALRWPAEEMRAGLREGNTLNAVVLFKFGAFDMNLPIDLEVRNISAEKGRIGCRFTNLNPGQISLLQFIVNAYITGEIVRVGDLMEIVARNNNAPKRSIPSATEGLSAGQKFKRRLKTLFNWTLVFGASAALLLYIGFGVWERAFIVAADSATVMGETMLIESPKSGKLFYQPLKQGTRVNKGTPLLMVETAKGNMVSVDSPCDCVIRERLHDNRATISTGAAVLRLISAESTPYVEAKLPVPEALRLSVGDVVMLGLPGFDHLVEGKIASMESGESAKAEATLYIEPMEKLPAELIGGPAEVKANTLADSK